MLEYKKTRSKTETYNNDWSTFYDNKTHIIALR